MAENVSHINRENDQDNYEKCSGGFWNHRARFGTVLVRQSRRRPVCGSLGKLGRALRFLWGLSVVTRQTGSGFKHMIKEGPMRSVYYCLQDH